MANYINGEILSEAYSHLDIELFHDAEKLHALKTELSGFFSERAKFLFGDDVEVQIEFEEGSLKTKIRVVSKRAAQLLLAAAVTYGSFREAVDYLSKDASLMAESANLEMIFRTKTAHCDRVAVEKRRGIFGRADDLLSELDLIKRNINQTSLPTNARTLSELNEQIARLNEWEKKSQKLFNKLETDPTKACIAAGFLEELERFPVEVPWVNDLEGTTFKAEIIKADPEHAGKVAGAAKQFQETVRYIKIQYENIVKYYAPQTS